MRRDVPREIPAAALALLAGIGIVLGLEFRWSTQLSVFHVALEIVAMTLIGAGVLSLARRVPWLSTYAIAVSLPVVVLSAIAIVVPIRLDTNVSTEYWMMVALHDAFLRGARFGTDVVFTFGPWGFLLASFHPKTAGLMFLLRAAIATVGVLTFWKLVERSSGRRGVAVLLLAALTVVVNVCWTDTFFHLIPFVVLFAGFERADDRKPALYFLLLAAGGLLSLAKFSILLMMAAAVIAVTLDEVRRRVPPWTAACYAIAIAAFWFLARQRVSDVLPYLRTSFELAAGYGEAMARDALDYPPYILPPFLISAIVFTIVFAFLELRRSMTRGTLLFGGWAALLLLLFKSGFVRADHYHVAPACGTLLLIELTYLAMRRRGRAATLALLVPIAFSFYTVEASGTGGIAREVAAAMRTSARDVVRLVRWPAFRDEMNRIHTAAAADTPVPPPGLRADVYPMPFGIIARPFTYQPRPLFVSYAAYTPRLAELNANWLRDKGPPAVLFDVYAIDRRLPSLQDGMSWPVLLTHYSFAGRLWRNVILERRPAAQGATLTPILARRARFGEKVPVSAAAGRPLFARIAIRLTRGGRVAGMLYKVPQLRIRVGLDDGTEKTFRFIRGMGEREFLLSPLVEDPDTFATLFTGDRTDWRHVVWFAIEPKTATSAYEPSYGIELLQLGAL